MYKHQLERKKIERYRFLQSSYARRAIKTTVIDYLNNIKK
jgi:hypothetical protein